jgi:dephospho-CoA kinase
MLKVGLTGGIGTGKSTASALFKDLGAFIFDADKEAKRLLDTSEIIQKELITEFGTDILNGENKIHRAKLARVSFQDEEHQFILNSIIHPHIFQIIDKSFDKVSVKNKHPVFIVDGALIFESGLNNHLDYTIVITAIMKHRMARVLENSNLTREDILRRIELQWGDEEKVNLADFTLRNDGTEKELNVQIQKVYAKLV